MAEMRKRRTRKRDEYAKRVAELYMDCGTVAETWRRAHKEGIKLSETSVRTIISEHLAREAPRLDAPFRWPQSMMGKGAPLDWEDAPFALDLLSQAQERGEPRPTARTVRWYSRLCRTAPEVSNDFARHAALELAFQEYLYDFDRGTGPDEAISAPDLFAIAEAILAGDRWRELREGPWKKDGLLEFRTFSPWKSDDHAARYKRVRTGQERPGDLDF